MGSEAIRRDYPVPVGSTLNPFSVSTPYVPKRYTAAGTYLVFEGQGGIHTLVVGVGATGGVVELFDDTNTASPANQIHKITATAAGWFLLDVSVVNGLIVKLTNAPDVTLS